MHRCGLTRAGQHLKRGQHTQGKEIDRQEKGKIVPRVLFLVFVVWAWFHVLRAQWRGVEISKFLQRDLALCKAVQIFMGVKGMSMRSMPKGLKALITALAKAGKEPVQPDSPTPLAPNKFKEVCTSKV